MKKILCAAVALGGVLLLTQGAAFALSPETTMLLQLLESKGVTSSAEADDFKATIEKTMIAERNAEHRHSVQSLEKRVEKLEKSPTEGTGIATLTDKVQLSGFVEVEASTTHSENANAITSDKSDIALATAELDIDAAINQYTNAHLAFLYEEGEENDHIIVDEGIIALNGGDSCPVYLNAGKMYVPFGNFESHFITDPPTLTLGETNDTAAIIGYDNELFDINFGAFSGSIKKTGKSDQINTFVGSATVTLPEKAVTDLALTAGVSYISNLATSDTLQGLDKNADGEISALVDGFSAYASLAFHETFFLDGEYLGAIDSFAVNDMTFTDNSNTKPRAWNIEAAAAVMPSLEVALRYGGSDEVGLELAEEMYGIALLYDILDNTSLTFEYLQQDFADNSKDKQGTMQLAVEF